MSLTALSNTLFNYEPALAILPLKYKQLGSYIQIENYYLNAKYIDLERQGVAVLPFQVFTNVSSPITPISATPSQEKISFATAHVSAITTCKSLTIKESEVNAILETTKSLHTSGKLYISKVINGSLILICIRSIPGKITASTEFEIRTQGVNFESKTKGELPTLRDFHSNNVVGYDNLVNRIIEEVMVPWFTSPEILERFKATPTRGMILYGPPGTGKTSIARAISKVMGIDSEVKIVNGPEIFAKYLGESEAKIRELFECEEGKLNIVIFDEIDAIAPVRGGSGGSSRHDDKAVAQLLTCIDGIKSHDKTFVIGITNRIDTLDTALLRAGRLELRLKVEYPSQEQRRDILRHYLRRIDDAEISPVELDTLAELTEGLSGADLAGAVNIATRRAMKRYITDNTAKLDLGDMLLAIENVQEI